MQIYKAITIQTCSISVLPGHICHHTMYHRSRRLSRILQLCKQQHESVLEQLSDNFVARDASYSKLSARSASEERRGTARGKEALTDESCREKLLNLSSETSNLGVNVIFMLLRCCRCIEPVHATTVGARIAFTVGIITAWTFFFLFLIVFVLPWILQCIRASSKCCSRGKYEILRGRQRVESKGLPADKPLVRGQEDAKKLARTSSWA